MTVDSALLVHPRTQAMLELYLQRPTHGLVLSGEEGSGKYHLAQWLVEKMESQPYLVAAAEDRAAITIDQIRQLYSLTRTGTRLVIIIKEAHQLGTEAQNAFLKLLEEPPAGTRFILTAHSTESLLPTIRSRLQAIQILPPPQSQLDEVLKAHNTPGLTSLTSLAHISGHLPGQFKTALQDEPTLQKQTDLLSEAKQFYSSSSFQRLKLLQANNYDKTWAQALLQNLMMIIRALLVAQANANKMQARLLTQATIIEETHARLFKTPGNPKIQLTQLALNL